VAVVFAEVLVGADVLIGVVGGADKDEVRRFRC